MAERSANAPANPDPPPIVLSLSGHDPTGGAGVQADIEAISAQGCYATTIVTCLTVQDTRNVQRIEPVAAGLLLLQAEALLADFEVGIVKIGLLGSVANAVAIAGLLADRPHLPVVFDPVLGAGGGANLANDPLLRVMREQLLPRTTLLTPNRAEARRLSGESDLAAAGDFLRERVRDSVLLTGADESEGRLVENQLLRRDGSEQRFNWPRFEGRFHGSGCTLASACAARLALGEDLPTAVKRAQAYTWQALAGARALGRGQLLPRRCPE